MYGDVGDARSLEEHSGDAGDSRIALEVRIKRQIARGAGWKLGREAQLPWPLH